MRKRSCCSEASAAAQRAASASDPLCHGAQRIQIAAVRAANAHIRHFLIRQPDSGAAQAGQQGKIIANVIHQPQVAEHLCNFFGLQTCAAAFGIGGNAQGLQRAGDHFIHAYHLWCEDGDIAVVQGALFVFLAVKKTAAPRVF